MTHHTEIMLPIRDNRLPRRARLAWRAGFLAVALSLLGAADLRAATTWIPQQKEATARARCSTCVPRSDSVRMLQEMLLMRIDSLKYEFEHERWSDARRAQLGTELRRSILALQESMEELHRENAVALTQRGLEQASAAYRDLPEIAIALEMPRRMKGYLGVVFDGTSRDFWRDNERIVQFYAYPRIALVEPSSPAERAGILQGDTLLAFNGADVREREISLSRLLIPKQKLLVRVRRDGYAKDLHVVVGEAPSYVASRAPRSPGAATPPVAVGVPAPRVWTGAAGGVAPTPSPATSPEPPGAVGVTPRSVWVFQEGVAGARVESIGEGLGRALGVQAGVLVLRAAPGTPAHESGLRDGDIIVRAAGRPVNNVSQLRSVLERQEDASGVRLVIVRERRHREVTLRW